MWRLARDLPAIGRGHPWIYAAALRPGGTARAGEVVDVHAPRGGFVARVYADPGRPIAARVLATAEVAIDDAFVRARVERACAIRRGRIDSDAVRLCHGENDFVPGLVLDVYGQTGVARFDGAGAEAFWRARFAAVVDGCARGGFPLARVWARGDRGGDALLGDAPGEVVVRERDARFEVDVVRGQKTGLFLDQRDNRRVVGTHAAGARVLNLFCYTGGFSVAAALGGARAVTSVDSSAPAIEAARRNLARNGAGGDTCEVVCGDAFAFLAEAARAGRAWDLVVCDPPSFAPSERALGNALPAYRDLNRAAAAVVAPGGLLATASCSSHVSRPTFRQVVAEGVAIASRDAVIIDSRSADLDHPVAAGFPEGEYLKFLLLRLA